MGVSASRLILVGLCFLFIVVSGLWLSRRGRPLHVGLSAVHKLFSLGAGIYLLVLVVQHSRANPLGAAALSATVATGLCFLVAVASGGFLSFEREMPVAILRVHQIIPALTILSSAATLYLVVAG